MLYSLPALLLAFASQPEPCPEPIVCPTCPVLPEEATCQAGDGRRRLALASTNEYLTAPRDHVFTPEHMSNPSAYEPARQTCAMVKTGYDMHCCNASAEEPFNPVSTITDFNCFVEAGAHIVHAEGFSGAKIDSLLTASECTHHDPLFNWQLSPRHPEGDFCYVGSFDGLNAMPILGNGMMQTMATGKSYMRTFINTEIRGQVGAQSAQWAISTSEDKGGFGELPPAPEDILIMHGAMEQFADLDRETLEVVNGGQTVKKVFTARGFPYNTVIPPTATSEAAYTIVKKHSDLHINVKNSLKNPDGTYTVVTEPNEPFCPASPLDPVPEGTDLRFCGLYGHCGSKISYKHEYSYTVDGVPAYGAAEGVGSEDEFVLVAQEGGASFNPPAGSSPSAPTGTVQILDVRRGHWYQLPHLSVGTIEMAFTISTGHPDYIAIGIEDYGDSSCGSGWTVWLGKKDKTSPHFLDRNGLGINQGRLYRFVAANGETDMATFVNWPASGAFEYPQVDLPGTLEPIDAMFDGRYGEFEDGYEWTRPSTNCAMTVSGKTPLRMTGVSKQEWGGTNPDKPNQWAIAETGLGKTKTTDGEPKWDKSTLPLGSDRASTLIFLEAEFKAALDALDGVAVLSTGGVASRNGSPLPESISAKVYHVMADQVVMGPQREAGLSYVDSLYWGKGDNVFFAEDSNAPGGYNIAGIYNLETRKTVTIAGAIGDDNVKFNNVANVPAGSIHRRSDQELTGWFDASASLTCDVDASTGTCSPQEMYDTQTSKHMILNNQMKGYGEGCMDYGFYYTAQMMYIAIPEFDWATTTLAAPTPEGSRRRKLELAEKKKFEKQPRRRKLFEECTEDLEGAWTDDDEFQECQLH